MTRRTKTYIAADWDGDWDAVDRLYAWKNSEHWILDFVDAHELHQARDTSLNCSIKRALAERLNVSKRFVLIVGDKTKNLTAGSCWYCNDYSSLTKSCYRGYAVDYKSYIEFECKKAVRDGLQIVVLYNSTRVNKSKCPDVLVDAGRHVAMKTSDALGVRWDYHAVKDAMM